VCLFTRQGRGWTLLLTAVLSLCLTDCGGDGKGNPVSEHTHDWGAWEVTTPATCDAAGVETRTCKSDATHKETRSIPKLTGVACQSGGSIVVKGTFTDDRNGQTYNMVKIREQTWMAENLNYPTSDSWCYDNADSNCVKYGLLYNWAAAKTACPSGWHLPSRDEWGTLAKAAGGTGDYGKDGTAGTKLKAASGWYITGGGTDVFGFSALPGGGRNSDGDFGGARNNGYWWTATESNDYYAYARIMFHSSGRVDDNISLKSLGLSVRCVKTD